MKRIYILTNDPSMTAWGWAVLDTENNVIESDCIKTSPEHKKLRIRKGDDTVRRINDITQELLTVLEKYPIRLILSELPHGSQNASAAVMIGVVAGIMQTFSVSFNIPIEWFSEQDAKKTILKKKAATKQEMIDAIDKKYDMIWTGIKYKDEAIADSLAIHYTALQNSNLLKILCQTSVR